MSPTPAPRLRAGQASRLDGLEGWRLKAANLLPASVWRLPPSKGALGRASPAVDPAGMRPLGRAPMA